VQSAASPKQVVRFLIWITNNAEALGKYISGFRQSAHPVPNADLLNKFSNDCNMNHEDSDKPESNSSSSRDSSLNI
jgi:hypothetical protein